MKNIFTLAVLFLSLNASANAEFDVEKCMEEANSNAAMKECAYQDYQLADAKLNQTYQALKSQFENMVKHEYTQMETVQRLIHAQRAWISFRDTNCSLYAAQMLGGTGEGLILTGCYTKMTKERTAELEQLKREFGSGL